MVGGSVVVSGTGSVVSGFSGDVSDLHHVVKVCCLVLELCRSLAVVGFSEVVEVSYDFGGRRMAVDVTGYGRVSALFFKDDYESVSDWVRDVMRRLVFPALGSAPGLSDGCLVDVIPVKGGV